MLGKLERQRVERIGGLVRNMEVQTVPIRQNSASQGEAWVGFSTSLKQQSPLTLHQLHKGKGQLSWPFLVIFSSICEYAEAVILIIIY